MIYTNSWFDENAKTVWDKLIPSIKPKKILEIGSYEGRSLCYLIEHLDDPLEIHAIDTWEGGADQVSQRLSKEIKMSDIESRFHANTIEAMGDRNIKLHSHKGFSDIELAKLFASGFKEYFDFIYVDGSHETTDTLYDMVLSLRLLKKGGVMVIDDYLWHVDARDNYRPKLAIDAFVNLHFHQVSSRDYGGQRGTVHECRGQSRSIPHNARAADEVDSSDR